MKLYPRGAEQLAGAIGTAGMDAAGLARPFSASSSASIIRARPSSLSGSTSWPNHDMVQRSEVPKELILEVWSQINYIVEDTSGNARAKCASECSGPASRSDAGADARMPRLGVDPRTHL